MSDTKSNSTELLEGRALEWCPECDRDGKKPSLGGLNLEKCEHEGILDFHRAELSDHIATVYTLRNKDMRHSNRFTQQDQMIDTFIAILKGTYDRAGPTEAEECEAKSIEKSINDFVEREAPFLPRVEVRIKK